MGGVRACLARCYYRWIDRSLDRPLFLAARRESLGDGEWNRFLGDLGERLAAKHLRRAGLKPLYRNFRAPGGGEVDLICRDQDELVFAEVKTRRGESWGRPVTAVDEAKQLLVIKGAMAWLRELNLPRVAFRFDVVEVVLEEGAAPRIEHLRNVFQTPPHYRW